MPVGRDAELAALDAVLTGARSGRGSSLLLWGEPGVGKTTLLDAAAASADDATVLRCAGIEAESALPFGGLTDLLRTQHGVLDDLRPARRLALLSALRLGPGGGMDRLAVFEAVVDLVDVIASRSPVLLLVDDLHWLDADTSECLAYLDRRISSRPVGSIASSRTRTQRAGSPAWVSELEVGPLPPASARALLRRRWPDLPTGIETSVLDAARGNPLALIELPAMLAADGRDSQLDPTSPLKLSPRLHEGFTRRLRSLPAATRDLLVLLALARTPTSQAISAIVDHAGFDLGDLEPALANSLVVADHGHVRFTHPLIRSAVVSEASAGDLRRAHRTLGDALDGAAAVWHRAACVVGSDDTVAAALHALAVDALERSSPTSAAEAFEVAANLTTSDDERADRLLAAGRAAFAAGDASRTVQLLDHVAALSGEAPERRAAAEHLAGVTTMWFTNVRDGHRRLLASADRIESAPAIRARMLADSALAATAWDCRHALDLARRAADLADGCDEETRAVCGTALMWCLTLRGQAREAAAVFLDVAPLLGAVRMDGPQAQSLIFALNWRVETEDYEAAMQLATAIAAAATEAGAAAGRAGPLIVAGDAARRLGRWDTSRGDLREALEIAQSSRQFGAEALASALLARLLAAQGDEEGCHSAIDDLDRCATALGMDSAGVFRGAAIGLLELGLDRPARAVVALEATHELAQRIGLADPLFLPYLPDLIEAHARLGHERRARELTTSLAEATAFTDAAGARAALARCEALTRRDVIPLERALELHRESGMPFEAARTLLVRGELLRRERKQGGARASLTSALATFEGIGASPWASRAAAELAAIDGRPDQRQLTNQELRIAVAAAAGARNREIAAELFLSEKTVERHLTSVYRFAGIRSRVSLGAWLATLDRPTTEQPG